MTRHITFSIKSITGLVLLFIGASILLASCNSMKGKKSSTTGSSAIGFYKVGHRGTRGLMPENTIPSMYKAIDLGANTIEFDIHITKDGQVVVYHDASFNPAWSSMPDGSTIKDRKKYVFYKMDYKDIRPFQVGGKPYPAYPRQDATPSYAPLLGELIDSVENYTKQHNLPPVLYLNEIKSSAATDGEEQPAPEEYITAMMKVLDQKKLGRRMIIQSFDPRPLQVIHRRYPDIQLGFLYSGKNTVEKNLEELGFTPDFYNPTYGLITKELVEACHAKGLKVIPWTVDDAKEMTRVKSLGVDGIISDYPEFY